MALAQKSPPASVTPATPTPATNTASHAQGARLVALDAFRGLTVVLMLLVNNTAVGRFTPAQLMHAPWGGGVNIADLVFPWFLFCAGVAIPYSTAARRDGLAGWPFYRKLLTRAFWLFWLGCLVVSAVERTPIVGLGVLQLIGLAFLVGALAYPLSVGARFALAAGLLLAYGLAFELLPVPGWGAGYFTEDRNIVLYLNTAYLAPLGLRGLPSVIPTGALMILASVVGDALRARWPTARKALALFVMGSVLALAGLTWNEILEFNKPVWTPSYILLSVGLGTLGILAFYLLADASRRTKWTFPLMIYGSNALLAYVAPILVKVWVLQGWTVSVGGRRLSVQDALLGSARHAFGNVGGGWVYTSGYILLWGLVLYVLYRKRIFLKV